MKVAFKVCFLVLQHIDAATINDSFSLIIIFMCLCIKSGQNKNSLRQVLTRVFSSTQLNNLLNLQITINNDISNDDTVPYSMSEENSQLFHFEY